MLRFPYEVNLKFRNETAPNTLLPVVRARVFPADILLNRQLVLSVSCTLFLPYSKQPIFRRSLVRDLARILLAYFSHTFTLSLGNSFATAAIGVFFLFSPFSCDKRH